MTSTSGGVNVVQVPTAINTASSSINSASLNSMPGNRSISPTAVLVAAGLSTVTLSAAATLAAPTIILTASTTNSETATARSISPTAVLAAAGLALVKPAPAFLGTEPATPAAITPSSISPTAVLAAAGLAMATPTTIFSTSATSLATTPCPPLSLTIKSKSPVDRNMTTETIKPTTVTLVQTEIEVASPVPVATSTTETQLTTIVSLAPSSVVCSLETVPKPPTPVTTTVTLTDTNPQPSSATTRVPVALLPPVATTPAMLSVQNPTVTQPLPLPSAILSKISLSTATAQPPILSPISPVTSSSSSSVALSAPVHVPTTTTLVTLSSSSSPSTVSPLHGLQTSVKLTGGQVPLSSLISNNNSSSNAIGSGTSLLGGAVSALNLATGVYINKLMPASTTATTTTSSLIPASSSKIVVPTTVTNSQATASVPSITPSQFMNNIVQLAAPTSASTTVSYNHPILSQLQLLNKQPISSTTTTTAAALPGSCSVVQPVRLITPPLTVSGGPAPVSGSASLSSVLQQHSHQHHITGNPVLSAVSSTSVLPAQHQTPAASSSSPASSPMKAPNIIRKHGSNLTANPTSITNPAGQVFNSNGGAGPASSTAAMLNSIKHTI